MISSFSVDDRYDLFRVCIYLFHFPAQHSRNQISFMKGGEIASEKALAMTPTLHFDGTLHVVIASEAKQSFTHKKRYLLKRGL